MLPFSTYWTPHARLLGICLLAFGGAGCATSEYPPERGVACSDGLVSATGSGIVRVGTPFGSRWLIAEVGYYQGGTEPVTRAYIADGLSAMHPWRDVELRDFDMELRYEGQAYRLEGVAWVDGEAHAIDMEARANTNCTGGGLSLEVCATSVGVRSTNEAVTTWPIGSVSIALSLEWEGTWLVLDTDPVDDWEDEEWHWVTRARVSRSYSESLPDDEILDEFELGARFVADGTDSYIHSYIQLRGTAVRRGLISIVEDVPTLGMEECAVR